VAQLHGRDIAHQDLKPSNLLVFEDLSAKIADLGRASIKNQNSPFDGKQIPGAGSYAPPEQLYRFPSPDWAERRIGADLYLLGSLVTFFFTGVGVTKMLVRHLEEAHRPEFWRGMFHDVLPYLVDAFQKVLDEVKQAVPDPFKQQVVE